MRAKVISIAGSDSSGGAGIQADIRTMERLGVTSACALTSVTAQSPQGVDRIDTIDPASVRAQLSTALKDQGACAIKIGMAGSAESIRTIANVLPSADIFTVCDPVVSSSSTFGPLPKILRRPGLLMPSLPPCAQSWGLSKHFP